VNDGGKGIIAFPRRIKRLGYLPQQTRFNQMIWFFEFCSAHFWQLVVLAAAQPQNRVFKPLPK